MRSSESDLDEREEENEMYISVSDTISWSLSADKLGVS